MIILLQVVLLRWSYNVCLGVSFGIQSGYVDDPEKRRQRRNGLRRARRSCGMGDNSRLLLLLRFHSHLIS